MYGVLALGLAMVAIGRMAEIKESENDNDASQLRTGGNGGAPFGSADPGGDLGGGHLNVGLDPEPLGNGGSNGTRSDLRSEPDSSVGNVRAGVINEPPEPPNVS